MAHKMSSGRTLWLITVLVMILLPFAARADTRVMKRLCRATSATVPCLKCVKSWPPEALTYVDVLLSLLHCADSAAVKLGIDTNNIIDQGGDEATEKALTACNHYFQAVIRSYWQIVQDVAHNNFDTAKADVASLIFPMMNLCHSVLTSSGISVPPLVVTDMLGVETNYTTVHQVLAFITE